MGRIYIGVDPTEQNSFIHLFYEKGYISPILFLSTWSLPPVLNLDGGSLDWRKAAWRAGLIHPSVVIFSLGWNLDYWVWFMSSWRDVFSFKLLYFVEFSPGGAEIESYSNNLIICEEKGHCLYLNLVKWFSDSGPSWFGTHPNNQSSVHKFICCLSIEL